MSGFVCLASGVASIALRRPLARWQSSRIRNLPWNRARPVRSGDTHGLELLFVASGALWAFIGLAILLR